MFIDDDNHWWSTLNCSDIWITFDCHQFQMEHIQIAFHSTYYAKKVEVYSSDQQGMPWSQWTKLATKENCEVNVRVFIQQNHSPFIALRFHQWTNGHVGITRLQFGFLNGTRSESVRKQNEVDRSDMIKAVKSSRNYKDHILQNIYSADGSYWCTEDRRDDPYITFDCSTYRVSALSIVYHPSYYARELTVYTRDQRDGKWSEWTVLTEKKGCGIFVDLQIDKEHAQFICLRFNDRIDWIDHYVGVSHIRFLLDSNVNDFHAMDIMPSAPPPEYEEAPPPEYEMNDQPPPTYAGQTDSEIEKAPTAGIEGGLINGGVTGGHHVVDIGGGTAATSDLEMWLNGLGPSFCSEYAHLFQENGFDQMAVVATMNDADLQSIGVSKMGHRRMMLMEIKKI